MSTHSVVGRAKLNGCIVPFLDCCPTLIPSRAGTEQRDPFFRLVPALWWTAPATATSSRPNGHVLVAGSTLLFSHQDSNVLNSRIFAADPVKDLGMTRIASPLGKWGVYSGDQTEWGNGEAVRLIPTRAKDF
jgi:hypothetical protein